jgi:hypothetical protein
VTTAQELAQQMRDGIAAGFTTGHSLFAPENIALLLDAFDEKCREVEEAKAEVARYWTSADMKPWVDLAESKGLGHFGKKLKGMFSRAMKAEDEARAADARAEAAEAEIERLREGLKPFAEVADHYDDREDDDFEVWVDAGPERIIRASFVLRLYRRARSALIAKDQPK